MPASAISRFVPAPSSRYGIPRKRQPSSASSIDCGLAASMKNSAGPPIPNDVRVPSGSPSRTPGRSRSHARLEILRQLIAQLSDIARTHQEENVARTHQTFEVFAGILKRADIRAVGDQVGEVARLDPGRVVLAGAVNVDHQHPLGAGERPREVLQ